MTERENLDRIIRALEHVLANGHALVPVPHKDLRVLIKHARADGEQEPTPHPDGHDLPP